MSDFDPIIIKISDYVQNYQANEESLQEAKTWMRSKEDAEQIVVEVLPLTNFVPSDPEHQDRLSRFPDEKCHIPKVLLHKYKNT